jgi:caffeoyl-CoA O-methyltransferase
MTNIFEDTAKELEDLDNTFQAPGGTKGYEGVWLPPDNIVRMWSVPRKTAQYLKDCVARNKPETILELGTSSGYSSLFLAAAARTYGGKVLTVEMAQPKIDIAQKAIDKVGFTDDIKIVPGVINDVLQTWSQKVDFVFLDADKLNYLKYIKLIEPHLTNGATIIADNVIDFGHLMQDYISYMQESERYETQMLELDNGLLISKKV